MKNRVFQLLLVALLFPILISCNEDEDIRQGKSSELAIVIDGGITTTRAVDADWESGDVIGVTMYNTTYTEFIDGVYNTPYVTLSTGTLGLFDAENEDETLYFPQNGDEIRLHAYYPYQAHLGSNMRIPWSVTDQLVLQDIDLMTAVHEQGFSKYETEVKLHFYHRLTKLIFILSVAEGEDFVNPEECELTIRGAETGNIYDLVDNRFLNFSTGEGDIEVPRRTGEPGTYRQAIVLPREAGEGLVFEFKDPAGDTYIARMSPDLELQSGNQYTFLIQLSENPVTVSAIIEPWIVRDPISYDTVNVGTAAGDSDGVSIGDVMTVYLQNEAGTDFDILRTFTYQSTNNWVPDAPAYWEEIPSDPAVFRAAILAQQPLNTSQLGDILIADEIAVARNMGINFELHHAASKVIIGLTSDTFTDQELAGATITLPDYLTGGYEEKAVFIPGTQRLDIVVDRTDPNAGIALFQPQTIAGNNTLLTVTIAGRNYDVKQPEDFTFVAGVAYQIIVTVHKEEITVSVRVVDWTNQSLDLDAITIGSTVKGAEGVLNGEVLQLYAGDETARTLLNSYTYYASLDSFTSPFPTYWESLDDPTTFYGAIRRVEAYNNTQLDDYLLSGPVTVPASYGVELELAHATARVVVELRSSDLTFSDDELAAMTLTLPDYITGGSFNNGIFIPGSTSGDITVAKNVGDNNSSAIAHIQPQTVEAGKTVITIQSPNGRTYTATYSDPVVYDAGQSTTLRVNLTKTDITLSATVTDWTSQTVSMVATSITLASDLGSTDNDFQDKSIYVFGLDQESDYTLFTYRMVGSVYQWAGEQNYYWDDIPTSAYPLQLPAVYYPANPSLPASGQSTFPWSIAADQTDPANNYYDNYDLLMSNNINLSGPDNLNFQFKHVLSQAEVNLIAGTGFVAADLVGATVTLPGYRLSGTANLSSATVTMGNGVATVTPRTITDGAQYMALVMPQPKVAGTDIVSITLPQYPNTPFIGKLTTALDFEPGKRTIINVTLQKTAIQLSATLAPWVNGQNGSIIIQ